MSINLELLPPLPDNLDDAIGEIIYLKEQLHRARLNFAQQVVEREKDGRAMRGNIKAVADENAELRKLLAASIKNNKENP